MRLLIAGCPAEAASTIRTMRFATALRPLHLCFWDAELESAQALLKAVGAGICLREVTSALLYHVDIALLLDSSDATRRAIASARQRMPRKSPLPAVVDVQFDASNGLKTLTLDDSARSYEAQVVCGVLFNAMATIKNGRMISSSTSARSMCSSG